jgi:adenylate cyclase
VVYTSARFGAGIATGYATLGTIGFQERFDYGAIGTVCNLAARLCGEAADGQILISPRVYAKVEPDIDVLSVGELSLKGFHRPVPAYNVLKVRQEVPVSSAVMPIAGASLQQQFGEKT